MAEQFPGRGSEANDNYLEAPQLLLRGKFDYLRKLADMRGDPDEVRVMLNFLRSLFREAQTVDTHAPVHPLAESFITSLENSPHYFDALIRIMKEAGFTRRDSGLMLTYFRDLHAQSRTPSHGDDAMVREAERAIAKTYPELQILPGGAEADSHA